MLRIQEHAAQSTQVALDGIFRAARHLPEDRFDWQPAPTARTARSQVLECVVAPLLHAAVLQNDPEAYSGAPMRAYLHETERLADADLDALEAAAHARHAPLLALIRAFPDHALEQAHRLPFGQGAQMSGAALLFLPFWNLVYHTGQINYIQTILGDTQMHL